MGRIKTAETISKEVTCIQFVRNSISETYEFLDERDMTVYLKNDRLSGTILDNQGNLVNITGKSWVVKDENEAITIYSPEDFAEHFTIQEEE